MHANLGIFSFAYNLNVKTTEHLVLYINGTVSEKIASQIYNYYIEVINRASRLNCYNFRTVVAIGLIFSTRHTAPLLCVGIYFGVLHKHSVDVMRSNIPWGLKSPQL